MAKKSKQAYRQAPWRKQLQSAGISLMPVIALAVLMAIYLMVSAEAAAAGLEIMEMHYEEEEILRIIANQRTDFAWRTSFNEMQKRAEKAGFEPAPMEAIHYMKITGYLGQNTVSLALPPNDGNDLAPIVNEYYQQSLWEWFSSTFLTSTSSREMNQ